ncbi:MAG: DAK2 domain-containing protein [Candidatus Heimdallarchaeota archaeon]|nr:DAK2 domain-containing protein [Candidatus Heimdallarchaeota archaeon]
MTFSGTLLKQMIVSSFKKIDEKTDYLNAINVFPVPDGDTGLNIYSTMRTIVEELDKISETEALTIKNASKAIAKGAFMGAKGNSGVILSQFFVGFAKSIQNCDDVTTMIFADALIEGSKRAYKAVLNPREGTILTVVKETAEAAKLKAEEGADWKELVEYCYQIAQKATLDTPNLMEELKKAKVVDAGALGFVYLIQGWLFVIADQFKGPRVMNLLAGLEGLTNEVDISHTEINYRYCTEAMIIASNSSEQEMRKMMEKYGDSLLIIGNDDELKLHVHTDTPQEAIYTFSSYGQLHAVKIDDMKTQALLSHK